MNDKPTDFGQGVLDMQREGHGYLRPKFLPSDRDIYISQSQIRKFNLRPADMVGGQIRPPKDNERYYGLLKVETINGLPAGEEGIKRAKFDELTAIYPNEQIKLTTTGKDGIEAGPVSTRIIDLLSPIGFGQRGLIVSPPKAGKTTILKEIANGITGNYGCVDDAKTRKVGIPADQSTRGSATGIGPLESGPYTDISKGGGVQAPSQQAGPVHIMAALIGERPEEVTDLSRHIKGEVIASNFDEEPTRQTLVAEIALERAKRLVEIGYRVIILLDSITRLARAYNLSMPNSGRTLSGGFDPAALFPAKQFFGAARNFEEGGSLTIIGTCLVETGSRMDELIYEEFKGTGNMELHLDRRLANRRVFPAINATLSGTRQEELLLDKEALDRLATLRKMLEMLKPDERTEILIHRLKKEKSNEEFLKSLAKG